MCLLVIFLATPVVLDSWSVAQEISNTASQIELFDTGTFAENAGFEIDNLGAEENVIGTISFAEKEVADSNFDARYAQVQQGVINNSLRLLVLALAVILAILVGAFWVYNNSMDEFGERRRDRTRRRRA